MFKREFKINFKSLLMWTAILALIYILIFSIYPSLMNDQTKQTMKAALESMPKEMLATFNMDIVGIEDAYGWFKTEGFMFLVLAGGAYSAMLGSTILLKEENDSTIEFLYSKPITRNQIITSKIKCGLLNIAIFSCTIALINYISFKLINVTVDMKEFLMISLSPILLNYMLFSICLLISTFMKKTKKAMSIAISIVFIEYFMQIIGGMGESIKIIKDISLFEFISSRYIMLNNSLNIKYFAIGIAIILISLIVTYIKYNKKELA